MVLVESKSPKFFIPLLEKRSFWNLWNLKKNQLQDVDFRALGAQIMVFVGHENEICNGIVQCKATQANETPLPSVQ